MALMAAIDNLRVRIEVAALQMFVGNVSTALEETRWCLDNGYRCDMSASAFCFPRRLRYFFCRAGLQIGQGAVNGSGVSDEARPVPCHDPTYGFLSMTWTLTRRGSCTHRLDEARTALLEVLASIRRAAAIDGKLEWGAPDFNDEQSEATSAGDMLRPALRMLGTGADVFSVLGPWPPIANDSPI